MRTTKIEQLTYAFEAYGYIVVAEPIEGQEEQFADHLASGLSRIEEFVKINAKQHGFRGLSKRALQSLHLAIPEPVWGVEVK